ncbi:RluA family pseudouridine synthase [Mycoplasmopsis gallinarum]|uniref:RNA pseudouridylate synthase n=1 Tax=Mycoplasmopsis gallinarum TaxID=29557 RepID=A0A162QHJ0_9BACT|nr:RluA family pseudouridine synthase [Mycoplasmopsis gallinarum]OAB48630.1 Ribosomal large subunit pseudouridine synthase C [Mycoplasmopsis gallinarum]
MAQLKEYKITEANESKKLLNFMKKILHNYSLSFIYSLFRKKEIKVNQKRIADFNYQLKTNDIVSFYLNEENKLETKTENFDTSDIKFSIIYEDKNILVVDKPIGISIHSEKDSLDMQVLKYLNYKNNLEDFRPSHIGRIDKETSGLMLYAKNHYALSQLNKKQNDFEKIYTFKSDYNGKNREIITKILINDERKKHNKAKEAITQIYNRKNQWFAKILTGRKHQIRISLAEIGYPIYGDKKYGGKSSDRMYLHSYKLKLQNLDGKLDYLNNTEFIAKIPWKV